jgi:hypothetical protein
VDREVDVVVKRVKLRPSAELIRRREDAKPQRNMELLCD